MVSKFNIRVYGIWLKGDKILMSNENIEGFKMLKLPGGLRIWRRASRMCYTRVSRRARRKHRSKPLTAYYRNVYPKCL